MIKKEDLFISIIIPCYNEEKVINKAYETITDVMNNELQYEYELLFIDDGSRDRTLEILKEISKKDSKIKILSFTRNFGHQNAVTAGINHCNGNIAIIMDADLQDPPSLIPKMVDKYLEFDCNIVYGQRIERKGESLFKKITAKWFYRFLNKISNIKIPLDTGDFRLIDNEVIEKFNELNEKNKFIRGLISWTGFSQKPLKYIRDERYSGKTKYPLYKMVKFALNGFMSFSKKPLMISVIIGFITIIIGIILFVYSIIAKFSGDIDTISGWTSTIITIIFLGGIQLFSLGLIGIYLGNIFDEVKDRPEYIIKDHYKT